MAVPLEDRMEGQIGGQPRFHPPQPWAGTVLRLGDLPSLGFSCSGIKEVQLQATHCPGRVDSEVLLDLIFYREKERHLTHCLQPHAVVAFS